MSNSFKRLGNNLSSIELFPKDLSKKRLRPKGLVSDLILIIFPYVNRYSIHHESPFGSVSLKGIDMLLISLALEDINSL